MGVEGAGRRGVEEETDVLGQGRPVVLESKQIVGPSGPDRAGNVALAPHGVDGDKGAGEFEPFEQQRDGDDLVALGGDRFLNEDDTLAGRPGRDQVQRMSLAPMGTPGGFAVDGDDVGLALAQALHPGRETRREGLRRKGVHHVRQGVVRGNAPRKWQQPLEKGELARSPVLDLDEVLRPREGPAQHHKQEFG